MAEFLVGSNPKSVSIAEYISLFSHFLLEYEYEQLREKADCIFRSSTVTGDDEDIEENSEILRRLDRGTIDNNGNESTSKGNGHISIKVDCSDLIHFDSSLAYQVVHHSKLLLPVFERAVERVYEGIVDHLTETNGNSEYTLHTKRFKFYVRLLSLPPIWELSKPSISDIRAEDICSLIQVAGTVIRTGT